MPQLALVLTTVIWAATFPATKRVLEQVLPHYVEQEKAFEKLTKDGFAGRIMYTDKQRERIEKEQDLRAQEYVIRSNVALIEQSEQKIAQITGLSVTSVKTRTHRTRLVLRKRLGRTCRALRPIALRAAGNVTGPGGATS